MCLVFTSLRHILISLINHEDRINSTIFYIYYKSAEQARIFINTCFNPKKTLLNHEDEPVHLSSLEVLARATNKKEQKTC